MYQPGSWINEPRITIIDLSWTCLGVNIQMVFATTGWPREWVWHEKWRRFRTKSFGTTRNSKWLGRSWQRKTRVIEKPEVTHVLKAERLEAVKEKVLSNRPQAGQIWAPLRGREEGLVCSALSRTGGGWRDAPGENCLWATSLISVHNKKPKCILKIHISFILQYTSVSAFILKHYISTIRNKQTHISYLSRWLKGQMFLSWVCSFLTTMLNCRELTWHSGLRGQAISHLSRVSQYFENPDTHKNININVSFFSSSASSDSLATPKKRCSEKYTEVG